CSEMMRLTSLAAFSVTVIGMGHSLHKGNDGCSNGWPENGHFHVPLHYNHIRAGVSRSLAVWRLRLAHQLAERILSTQPAHRLHDFLDNIVDLFLGRKAANSKA